MKFKIHKNIRRINLKSILFNFKYFEFSTAIKLPVLIHGKTNFLIKGGTVTLPKNAHFGMVKFGYGGAFFEVKNENSVWQLDGALVFKGAASFGNGTTISVLKNSQLVIGNNFSCGSNSKILCRKEIVIGNDCLLSWNVAIMDTDFHTILNHENEIINTPKRIEVEDNVWIGCNSTILKGVKISKGSIIAANTTMSKSNDIENSVVASNIQVVVKQNVKWKL